ncbi:hypothetical protein BGZ76_011323 [Entomortierella beljakovae]|nr:hypothetical protein BGZ76_011323 [Entomortierella beljakovae]
MKFQVSHFELVTTLAMAVSLLPSQSMAMSTPSSLEKGIASIANWYDLSKARVNTTIASYVTLSERAEPVYAWSNWAGNQHANPAKIFKPKTVEELYTIIADAKTNNKKVRAAGTGHTWTTSSVVNQDGYMISVNDMNKIYTPVKGADGIWTVEVETGVTILELDNLLRNHNPPLAIASNIVIETVRYGGIMSMGCHGAATNARSMPDLVTEVKIVDSNGTLNTFSREKDPLEFSAATVNLGLLGIIYSYTFKVEPMFNLLMTDTHPLVNEYFSDPKIDGPKLKKMVLGNDGTQIYYWPFNTPFKGVDNDELWIKQWTRTTAAAKDNFLQDTFSDAVDTLEHILGSSIYNFINKNPKRTPYIIPLLYLTVKADSSVPMHAPNAIHYRAGIDKIPVLSMEMMFKVDENFENVVKAFRYVIDEVYNDAKDDKYPLNLTMDMRFIKSSDMIMSPAYDVDPEAIYCTMEIVAAKGTPGFEEASAKVAKYWMDNFNAKPHWSKMWEHVPGIIPYLRSKQGAQYDQFEAIRQKYDPNGMFLTETYSGLLGH